MQCPVCQTIMSKSASGTVCPKCGHSEQIKADAPGFAAVNSTQVVPRQPASNTINPAASQSGLNIGPSGISIGVGQDPYIDPDYGVNPYNQPGISIGGRIGGLLSIIFGLIFAAIGFFVYKSSLIPSNYIKTEGQVVQEVPVSGTQTVNGYQRPSTSFAPVIQFSVQGKSYTFQSSSSSNPPAFNIEQTIPERL